MTNTQKGLFAAAAACAGGLIALYFIAPDEVRKVRNALANRAREQSRRLEGNLHQIEDRLAILEQQLHEITTELGQHLDKVKQQALEQYIPAASPESTDWKLTREDVDQDLPHLPGR
jgi:chromosome segregation ATPase